MKKTYISPETRIINLYTKEEIAQQEETGLLQYSRKIGEFPDEDLSKDGSEFDGFFDAEDEDEEVIGGSNKPWWRR